MEALMGIAANHNGYITSAQVTAATPPDASLQKPCAASSSRWTVVLMRLPARGRTPSASLSTASPAESSRTTRRSFSTA